MSSYASFWTLLQRKIHFLEDIAWYCYNIFYLKLAGFHSKKLEHCGVWGRATDHNPVKVVIAGHFFRFQAAARRLIIMTAVVPAPAMPSAWWSVCLAVRWQMTWQPKVAFFWFAFWKNMYFKNSSYTITSYYVYKCIYRSPLKFPLCFDRTWVHYKPVKSIVFIVPHALVQPSFYRGCDFW